MPEKRQRSPLSANFYDIENYSRELEDNRDWRHDPHAE